MKPEEEGEKRANKHQQQRARQTLWEGRETQEQVFEEHGQQRPRSSGYWEAISLSGAGVSLTSSTDIYLTSQNGNSVQKEKQNRIYRPKDNSVYLMCMKNDYLAYFVANNFLCLKIPFTETIWTQ